MYTLKCLIYPLFKPPIQPSMWSKPSSKPSKRRTGNRPHIKFKANTYLNYTTPQKNLKRRSSKYWRFSSQHICILKWPHINTYVGKRLKIITPPHTKRGGGGKWIQNRKIRWINEENIIPIKYKNRNKFQKKVPKISRKRNQKLITMTPKPQKNQHLLVKLRYHQAGTDTPQEGGEGVANHICKIQPEIRTMIKNQPETMQSKRTWRLKIIWRKKWKHPTPLITYSHARQQERYLYTDIW